MSPTQTAEALAAEQVPPTRMPLPGDPEDAAIDEACRDLRLPAFCERFVELAAAARRAQSTYKQFLLDLLRTEVADRDVCRQQRLVRAAKFPRPKRLEDFDFDKNPNVSPEVVADLKSTSWVRESRPLVLIGDPGTGKSHLLIGVCTAIAEAGLSVRYITTQALVNELAEAEAARRLSSLMARYTKVDLLCWTRRAPSCCSRSSPNVRNARPPRSPRNPPFAEWDKTFGDRRLCAAFADRITFRCTLIQTSTESYRFQSTEADRQAAAHSWGSLNPALTRLA